MLVIEEPCGRYLKQDSRLRPRNLWSKHSKSSSVYWQLVWLFLVAACTI